MEVAYTYAIKVMFQEVQGKMSISSGGSKVSTSYKGNNSSVIENT